MWNLSFHLILQYFRQYLQYLIAERNIGFWCHNQWPKASFQAHSFPLTFNNQTGRKHQRLSVVFSMSVCGRGLGGLYMQQSISKSWLDPGEGQRALPASEAWNLFDVVSSMMANIWLWLGLVEDRRVHQLTA